MIELKQAIKKYQISPRTLRYYEEIGILKPTRRGQKRLYSDQDIARLEFTLMAKSLAIPLSEISELFELHDSSQAEETQLFRYIQLLRTQQRNLQIKQDNLSTIKSQIDSFEKICLQQFKDKGLIS